ncbi:CBS domain-containing protein [Caminibacter pacificus]
MDLNDFIINRDATIIDALKKIDKNKKGFLIVVDEFKKVVGTLTDGDIRRELIKGRKLENKIEYNRKYEKIYTNESFFTISEKFKSEKISFLPIVNEDNVLQNVITKKQFHVMMLKNYDYNLDKLDHIDEKELDYEIYNRPWGYYKSTLITEFAQSKIITIFKNEELSLQEHKKREEHWIVIWGKGKAILGESEIELYPGKYLFVPKGCKHKIVNTSTSSNLVLTEVQLGTYFGEDDIIRYEDKYGRK